MTKGIAIIGAGGFVGTSLVEALTLHGTADVRAIVRRFRSFAGLSRFGAGVGGDHEFNERWSSANHESA